MLIDAHLHITREDLQHGILTVLEEEKITGFVSAGDAEECLFVQELAVRCPFIIPTFGLHPWNADSVEELFMEPFLEKCAIIGEIGMDSVWCNVDLNLQREVFISQLDLAEERECPVLLHTKGQEMEVAEIIRDYSMPIIVHWYSCMEHLDLYLERDCYFTVGPDVLVNEAVQRVAQNVPLSRLLVETDGVASVEWATGQRSMPKDLPRALYRSMDYIAREKGIPTRQVELVMEGNLRTFCSYGQTMSRIREKRG